MFKITQNNLKFLKTHEWLEISKDKLELKEYSGNFKTTWNY